MTTVGSGLRSITLDLDGGGTPGLDVVEVTTVGQAPQQGVDNPWRDAMRLADD